MLSKSTLSVGTSLRFCSGCRSKRRYVDTLSVQRQTMTEPEPEDPGVDVDARLDVLEQLLVEYPGGVVSAIDAHGNPVPAPPSLCLPEQNSLSTRSPLEVVAPASRGSLVDALVLAKQAGVAAVPVIAVDGTAATCHVIDLRPTHGVLVGMIATDTPIDWSIGARRPARDHPPNRPDQKGCRRDDPRRRHRASAESWATAPNNSPAPGPSI